MADRDAPYNMLIIGMTDKPAEVESRVKWARDLWDAIQPFSSGGVYVNYLGRGPTRGSSVSGQPPMVPKSPQHAW